MITRVIAQRTGLKPSRGPASAPCIARWPTRICYTVLIILLTLSLLPVAKADLPSPTGKVLLVISGNIESPNVDSEAHIDRAILESLPVVKFTTHTPWSDGATEFEGVRLNELLDLVGSESYDFKGIALDDYAAEFMGVDLEKYPVIVAYRQDGKNIGVRQLGPLRIMFPFDDYPELLNQSNMSMLIWQITEMVVH